VLAGNGVEIVGRNVRSGRGEVDLVGTIDGERVVVEVKTLIAGAGADDPIVHFDAVKRARVRTAALGLEPKVYRVDLVTVVIRPDWVDVRWLPRVA
jgi:Holliday junction resolvase-like predicted endonuclease